MKPYLLAGLIACGLLLIGGLVVGVAFLKAMATTPRIPESAWQDFSPANGRCTARMPGTPTTVDLVINDFRGKMSTLELPRNKSEFGLAYFELPDGPARPELLQKILELQREGMEKKYNVKAKNERPITLAIPRRGVIFAYPGRELEFDSTKSENIVMRLYLMELDASNHTLNRLYMLIARGPGFHGDGGDAGKFFDSFTVDPVEGRQVVKNNPPPGGQPPELPTEPLPGAKSPPPATDFPGLLLYLNLDEGQGTTAADSSGKGNDAIVKGAKWTTGIRGKGLRFDGNGDYVDYGAGTGLNFAATAPFTIAAWFQTTQKQGALVSHRNSKSGSPVLDITLNGGKISALVREDGNEFGQDARVDGPQVDDGQWHHFALTRNAGNEIELFLDGVSCGRKTGAQAGGALTCDWRALGSERYWAAKGGNNSPHFQGFIDEYCIFDRALKADEIRKLAG
jgi:hypothetical protein